MLKIGFLGAGEMAHGILSAIPERKQVLLSSVEDNRNAEIAASCELIFLAVRPQNVEEVAAEVKPLLSAHQTLVSIVAGRSIASLRKAFGNKVKIIRVMPNLCLKAGEGMCALTASASVRKSAAFAEVQKILGKAGKTIVLPERAFDAVTALSGSGPAYFAYMQKCMEKAGTELGLDKKVAALLAAQTMYGTAKYLRESAIDLDKFIAGVCTKGGTTDAGMKHLSRPVFYSAVRSTLFAASARSAELGR